MKRITQFIAFCLLALPLSAQQYTTFECGTPPGASMERLIKNIESASTMEARSGVQYLPVTMTLIANDDGSNRIDEESALDGFCALNENFESIGVQFYLNDDIGFRYVDDSDYYLISISGGGGTSPASIKVANTINIFVSEVLTPGTGASCTGVLGFYSPVGDYVAIDKCVVDSESFALTHELGHFFSLQHTFFGWENEDYDNTQPTPAFVGGIRVEYADGSNCALAADRICDTPPDYNFGLGWNSCEYTPDAFDPAGEPVDPDEENYMGYFFNCDEHSYSPMQGDVIIADIADQTFVSGSPNTATITESAVLTSPIDGTMSPPQNTVLTWEAPAGANKYLVEVNRLPNFSPSFTVHKSIVTTNSLTLNDLAGNTTLHWRVRAFNEHYTCTDYTAGASFKTDELIAVEQIEGVESFAVYPNPSKGNDVVTLEINTIESFDADIAVYNIQGKVVRTAQQHFNVGNNFAKLHTEGLSTGTYILKVSSEDAVLCKRIVIGE